MKRKPATNMAVCKDIEEDLRARTRLPPAQSYMCPSWPRPDCPGEPLEPCTRNPPLRLWRCSYLPQEEAHAPSQSQSPAAEAHLLRSQIKDMQGGSKHVVPNKHETQCIVGALSKPHTIPANRGTIQCMKTTLPDFRRKLLKTVLHQGLHSIP